MSSEESSSHLVYNPFAYPPNYELAKIHQNATMPGKPHPNARTCPCCKEKEKSPFPNWWGRSIEKDFKSFGGGVVGYFWLLRLYSFSIVAIIVIYGAYLQYLVNYYCENEQDPKIQQKNNQF